MDDEEKPEPVAWVIRPTTWRAIVQRLRRRYLPRPVLALGQQELYSVLVHGTGFALPIEDGLPVDGFFTSRIVAARDVREAKRRALSVVEGDWQRSGRGSVNLEAQEIRVLEGRFRVRSGGGATFYRSSDEDG